MFYAFNKKEFYYILTTIFISLSISNSKAQTVAIEDNSRPAQEYILAYHYANGIYQMKKLTSDENGFALFYNNELKSGIYYILFSDSSSISFMYDADFPKKIRIIKKLGEHEYLINGSEITNCYNDYLNFIKENIVETFPHPKTEENKKKQKPTPFVSKVSKSDIDSIINQGMVLYPESILSKFFQSQKKITPPDYIPKNSSINRDSAIWSYQLNYFYNHFLDNLDLADSRLIYTPVYCKMIDKYLDKITRQNPISIKTSIDLIIARASSDSISKSFVINYLLKKYEKNKNIALYEIPYLYIIHTHILKSSSLKLSKNDKVKLTNEYNLRKPASLGQIAPAISCLDINKQQAILGAKKADYTILYFYNYECPVCQIVTKEINVLTSRFSYLNIDVFTFCTGTEFSKAYDYISKASGNNWTNAWDINVINDVVVKYNLVYTPSIFFLNSKQEILHKNINTSQLEEALLEIATLSNTR